MKLVRAKIAAVADVAGKLRRTLARLKQARTARLGVRREGRAIFRLRRQQEESETLGSHRPLWLGSLANLSR